MPWLGLILSPHLLQRHLRTTFAIQDICLQTQPRPFRSLPLWSHFPSWSRCRKAFPGPFLPLKAQVGLPGLLLRCKVPIISSRTASLDPWSWPGRGSDVPAFNLPWWHLVPPPPSAGAPAMTFQSSAASLLDLLRRRWLQDQQWKISVLTPGAWLDFSPGPAVKTPCPTPRRLVRFCARTGSENPLSYHPALGSIFRQDQQWKPLSPTTLSLARFFSCHIPFPRHVQRDPPAFCPCQVWFLDPRCLNSRYQLPHLLFLPLHLSRRLSRPTRLFRWRPGPCRMFRPSCRIGKTLSSDSMMNKMMGMLGAAPPQPSMGPTVPPWIIGPDELRQPFRW